MSTFTFHCDPGHGWLEVTLADLLRVGLSIKQISRYSYYCGKRKACYLEEDCDAPKFIAAYRHVNGREPAIREVHSNAQSFIRNLPRLNG